MQLNAAFQFVVVSRRLLEAEHGTNTRAPTAKGFSATIPASEIAFNTRTINF